jgi:MmyB-like transcription regulator ligand binding domain
LRSEAGRDPHDRRLSELVGKLSMQSQDFRTRWAAHNVRFHDKGVKRFHHPVVGDLTLSYDTMQLSADPGLTMAAYTADPGSKSEEALNLLASWAATIEQEEIAQMQERA